MKSNLMVLVATTVTLFHGVAAAARADDAGAADQRLIVLSREFGEWGLVECDALGKEKRLFLKGHYHCPAWSPDGKRIAYHNEIKPEQLFVMNADGSEPKQLTHTEHASLNAAWSPDGERIAFQVHLPEIKLYWVDPSGGEPVKLSTTTANDADPAFSPDGKRIAFGSWPAGGQPILHLMGVDGADRVALPEVKADWVYPAWSPDGRLLAFGRHLRDGELQLFVTAVENPSARQVTRTAKWNDFAAWSPNGRYIAYVHYDEWPQDGAAPADGDLVVFNVVEETHTTVLRGTLPRYGDARPAWKPLPKEDG